MAVWRIERALVPLTVTAGSAYAANDVVGGLITVPLGIGHSGGGFIQSVMLVDKDNEKASFTLYFWSEKPTSIANDAAFIPQESEAIYQIGSISLPATQYTSLASNAYAIGRAAGDDAISGKELAWEYAPSGAIYCYMVCTGTPTYTAADDLILRVTMFLS